MNGLAGIVYPDVYQVDHLIQPMIDVILGGKGGERDLHTYNNIQIGTADSKLAVNGKKTIIGGFSGVLYNAGDLSRILKQHGFPLLTDNLAEIIIHAYEHWGESFCEKLDGEFALMVLDPKKQQLVLARDRIGKKSLYWYQDDNHFIFSTQLKGLLSTGAVPLTPAKDALGAYLSLGYFPQDLTPIQGVNKLLPGHYLIYHFNKSLSVESYWSYSSYFQKTLSKHKNLIVKQLDNELRTATKKRVPVSGGYGCFVSGGLGSATAAYYVQQQSEGSIVPAFTAVYQGENEEDLRAAEVVCERLNLAHQETLIDAGELQSDLCKIVWYLDEPLGDVNIAATWRLAKLASASVGTAFSGMGADELLAGHNRYTVNERHVGIIDRLWHAPSQLLAGLAVPLLNRLSRPLAYKLLRESHNDPWKNEYLRQNALFTEEGLKKAAPHIYGLFDLESFLQKFYHLNRIHSRTSSLLYFDVKTRLPDCFILQYERLNEAHGVAWTSPFLDRQVIEYLAGLPEPEDLSQSETAAVLKGLMGDVLPDSFINRPKTTRKHFLESWLIPSGINDVFGLLKRGTLVETGIISETWLESVLGSADRAKESFRQLWGVLILEIWFRLFINRPIGTREPEMSVEELFSER